MGRIFRNFDWITTLLLILLGSFGMFILLTINPALFTQQMLYLILGLVLLYIVSRIDPIILWWSAPIGYILANILLFLSFFGPAIRGATRWIFVGPLQLQPSELAKPLFLIAFARAIAAYPPRYIRYLPLHVAIFALPFLLIFRQPDLGTALVYASFWIAMMLAGGLPVRYLAASVLALVVVSPLLWGVLAPYQRARIETFINPTLDPRGAGYNALQATIAVGSGQWFGRGLGRGTQSHLRFLPEYHTDFIFATLVEEFGLVGGFLLLTIYGALLLRILAPLLRGLISDIFPFAYAVGLFTMILTQIFINAGMNMGIIPVTGITLPFVSYGGSSILSLTVAFGLSWALRRAFSTGEHIEIGRRTW